MTAAPRVSVVMCAYNGIGLIEKAVADILAQSFTDFELVISDDGSTDATRDYLRSLSDQRVRLILQDRNIGYVANKNSAFASARGDLITQQDQDDRSDPDRLARQVEALDRSGLAIVGCGYRRLDYSGKIVGQSALEEERVIGAYDPSTAYPFWFPALLVHRSVIDSIGLFDPFFAGAFGDDLYWVAKANQRFPIHCFPDRLYTYVESPGSITSVAGSDRKLVMGALLMELLAQRAATGTDDLEQGRVAALETRLLGDRHLIARQLQVYASRAIDQHRLTDAQGLIGRAFRKAPFRPSLLRTIVYYFRMALYLLALSLGSSRQN